MDTDRGGLDAVSLHLTMPDGREIVAPIGHPLFERYMPVSSRFALDPIKGGTEEIILSLFRGLRVLERDLAEARFAIDILSGLDFTKYDFESLLEPPHD